MSIYVRYRWIHTIYYIYKIPQPSPESQFNYSSFSFNQHLWGLCDVLAAFLDPGQKQDTMQALRRSPSMLQGGGFDGPH